MTAMLRPAKLRHSGISFRILALEPRMMFDGAAAGDVADKTAADSKSTETAAAAATTTDTDTSAKSTAAAETDKSTASATVVHWNGQVSTDTTGTRNEVVVVDTTVADWQTLVAGINPNTPVILLSPNADGMGELEVLAKIMSQFHDLDAIHLVAEGRTGAILLGNEVIWNGDMTAASPYLATIGAALKDGGDFMLYSCSVAGSDNGKAFVDDFARALGNVDVAASTDRTGPTILGGDWDLEYKTGDIETVLPFTLAGMQDISHCLGCTAADSDNTVLLNGTQIAHFNSGIDDWVFDQDVHVGGVLLPAGSYTSDAGQTTHAGEASYVIDLVDECAVTGPTVTDAKISITSTGSGTGGAYKVGDTVTARWDNTASGDNQSGITGVVMDFSAFGGGTAVTATNSGGIWTASYVITAGSIDATNRNVSVKATSALTQTQDSHGRVSVRFCGHGPDRQPPLHPS